MKGNQAKGFSCVMAIGMAALLALAAKTFSDYRDDWVKGAQADARTATYFAAHSGSFFEGVWYDWDDDETITLGCLEVKGNIREGSYNSATGPRATSNVSINGTYNIDSDSSMQVIGKDRDGKTVKFIKMIYVEDPEYPTQMIVIDEKGRKLVHLAKEVTWVIVDEAERKDSGDNAISASHAYDPLPVKRLCGFCSRARSCSPSAPNNIWGWAGLNSYGALDGQSWPGLGVKRKRSRIGRPCACGLI